MPNAKPGVKVDTRVAGREEGKVAEGRARGMQLERIGGMKREERDGKNERTASSMRVRL